VAYKNCKRKLSFSKGWLHKIRGRIFEILTRRICSLNTERDQGWPTGWSHQPVDRWVCHLVDCTWFCIELTSCLKITFFDQYSRKYIKIIHPLVGYVYSLVPLVMADHRLARQMPRGICNTFLGYCVAIKIVMEQTLCLLSVHHLLRRWYTAFAHVILNIGILYLWLYYQLVDRELSRNFLVDPSRRQVGHPWNRQY